MSAVAAVESEPVVVRRCRIDEVFASPFIELLMLAPRNPIVRGLILAQTRKVPGQECETFEQIKQWVEITCEKRLRSPNEAPARAHEGIVVVVDFSDTEYGSANYSVKRSAEAEFEIPADELLGVVRDVIESGSGLEAVVENISALIHDEAWDRCEPGMDDYADYDYGDHEGNGAEDRRVEFSKVQARELIRTFLRERHPDLLEALV